jgi:hypothetical protein
MGVFYSFLCLFMNSLPFRQVFPKFPQKIIELLATRRLLLESLLMLILFFFCWRLYLRSCCCFHSCCCLHSCSCGSHAIDVILFVACCWCHCRCMRHCCCMCHCSCLHSCWCWNCYYCWQTQHKVSDHNILLDLVIRLSKDGIS